MKNKEQIEKMISELRAERDSWIKKQREYNWTREERANGSEQYGYLQEREAICNRLIELLIWVING